MRVFACFTVVLAHCCDPFVGQGAKDYSSFLTGAFWGSATRFCVPLFVMISGVLLLPVGMDMADFFKKRLKRVVIPFIAWSILLPLLYFVYFQLGFTTGNPNVTMDTYTWSETLTKISTFIFNFNYDTTPLWYIYMLVGLYLFMPIIGTWLTHATKKDIKCFLYIWIISLFIPYVQLAAPFLGYQGNYGDMGILGICSWNAFSTFYYFSGFLGYIVLAYYLKTYPLNWTWGKTLRTAIPLFLIGYAITAGGFILTQKLVPDEPMKLEIVWSFSNINVFLMTFACFIVLQKLPVRPTPFLSKLAALTFGIYLCHFFFVQCGYDIVKETLAGIPYALQIPCIAIIAFLISLLVTWLLSLSRLTKRSVM